MAKVDFKELEKFADRISKLKQKDIDNFNEDAIKELAQRLFAKVIKRTPVGKKPTLKMLGGESKTVKAKGNSGKSKDFLSKQGAIIEQYWNGYVGGDLRRGWTIGSVTKTGTGYQIEVINPTEYASYVELGHRQEPGRFVPMIGKQLKKGWVPGKFMLTISEKELERDAPRILENKLNVFWRDVLNG